MNRNKLLINKKLDKKTKFKVFLDFIEEVRMNLLETIFAIAFFSGIIFIIGCLTKVHIEYLKEYQDLNSVTVTQYDNYGEEIYNKKVEQFNPKKITKEDTIDKVELTDELPKNYIYKLKGTVLYQTPELIRLNEVIEFNDLSYQIRKTLNLKEYIDSLNENSENQNYIIIYNTEKIPIKLYKVNKFKSYDDNLIYIDGNKLFISNGTYSFID